MCPSGTCSTIDLRRQWCSGQPRPSPPKRRIRARASWYGDGTPCSNTLPSPVRGRGGTLVMGHGVPSTADGSPHQSCSRNLRVPQCSPRRPVKGHAGGVSPNVCTVVPSSRHLCPFRRCEIVCLGRGRREGRDTRVVSEPMG